MSGIRPDFYKVTDLELTSIADAIRDKTGISSLLTYPNGFIDGINQLSDNTEEFMGIFNRTSSVVSNSQCTSLRPMALYGNKTITNVSFPNCVSIGVSAFAYCSSLTSVFFPNCTTIGNYAFASCTSLSLVLLPKYNDIFSSSTFYSCASFTISLPSCISVGGLSSTKVTQASLDACTTIAVSAFCSCSLLTEVLAPNCETISTYAFQSCKSLSYVSFSKCSAVGDFAFYACTTMQTAFLPQLQLSSSTPTYLFMYCYSLWQLTLHSNISIIPNNTFAYCSSLSSVNDILQCTSIGGNAFRNCILWSFGSFSQCTYVGSYAFACCSTLSEVSLPMCQSILGSTFASCYNLKSVFLSQCSSIGASAFYRCYNLISLDFRNASSVPTLYNRSVFFSTPISTYSTSAGQYGSIYVPASLYDAFKTKTNWTYFSNKMVSV